MKKTYTGKTRLFLAISGAIIAIALIMQVCGVGLNLGIDFTGGSVLNYSVGEEYAVEDVETVLNASGYTDNQITKAAPSTASIALQEEIAAAKAAEEAAAAEEEAAAEETATEEASEEEVTEEAAAEETTVEEASEEEVTEEAAAEEEATEEAAEEEAAEPETYLLDPDKSGIEADGMTDLQIRLKLVDETEGMEDCLVAAVGGTKVDYRTLTNLEITNAGYSTAFAGGIVAEFDMGGDYDIAQIEETVKAALEEGGYKLNDIQFIRYDAEAEAAEAEAAEEAAETEEAVAETEEVEATGNYLRILIDMDDVTSQVRATLEKEMTAKYENFRFVSIDHVSAIAGKDLLSNAVKALLIAFACMMIYIALRFDPMSGCAALAALLHDILIMCSFMVFFRGVYQVNSSFIAAILTIVGYSINNTIIIFDRIRETRKKPGYTQKSDMEVVEVSVGSTIARTINTTLTTLFTLVCLYIFGVSSIREFAFPLLVGMLAGTYSSVLLSGQVWAMWHTAVAKKKTDKK